MLSRVADSIYWMCRYIERAENVARSIDVNLQLQLDLPGEERPWEPVIQTGGSAEEFFRNYSNSSLANALQFLTFDRANPSSIICCIESARENARCIREFISTELWMHINRCYLKLNEPGIEETILDNPHEFYTGVKEFSQLAAGIINGTMCHDIGWHFCRLGTLTERADQTSRILDVKYYILLPDPGMVGMVLDTVQWTALLKSVSAFEMFRKRYSSVTPRNVSEFLLLNPDFPRSLLFCVRAIERSLKDIAEGEKQQLSSIRKIGRMRAELEFTPIQEIIAKGLHESIEEFQLKLGDLTTAVRQNFFA